MEQMMYSNRSTVDCHNMKYTIPTAEGIVNNNAMNTGQAKITITLV